MTSTLCQAVKNEHTWSAEEKNAMRRLFEHILRRWPNLVTCLRETQGQLVYNASRKGFNFKLIADFDLHLVELTRKNNYDEAMQQTAKKLKQSVEQFWPDCPLPSYRLLLTEMAERLTESAIPAADQATAP